MKLILVIIVTLIASFLFKFFATKTPSHDSEIHEAKPPEPENWPALKTLIDKNTLPSIKITLVNKKPQTPYQSKFGGKPYWPQEKEYPKDIQGNPLIFIAQINFSELPGNNQYPSSGMLQFFISNEDLWGMEFFKSAEEFQSNLNQPKNYAVVYHTQMTDSIAAFDKKIEAALNSEMTPYSGESSIAFSIIEDIPSPADYRFEKATLSFGKLDDKLLEYAYETLPMMGHKMGGYASFTQDDPRAYYAPNSDWLLLFQMDTDYNDHIDIMWGDAGIGNFFIRADDFKNLQFDHVWFNWDCH